MPRVIVVGGGLSGMSCAHTVVQAGGNVLVLDKSPFNGGNSTKATSGINAAGTTSQRLLGIADAPEVFEEDTTKSAAGGARPHLIRTLTHESGPCVEWLKNSFALDLSVVSRLAAHSNPRTHRGGSGGQFPGMMITYALMEALEAIADDPNDDRAEIINRAKVHTLLKEGDKVVGCQYTDADGQEHKEYGPVVICTGGFGADFTDGSLLAKVQPAWLQADAWKEGYIHPLQVKPQAKIPTPDLLSLPTTNGPHCTGDGIKMCASAGAATCDMEYVQVHPTGLVDPRDPNAKVRWLAAEALRGHGGILLDNEGKRFADELGKRDYVTSRMWSHAKPPYRLCLNSAASAEIAWHCEHYGGRGLMKELTGEELAAEIGVSPEQLQATFNDYNHAAETKNDEFNKRFFRNTPLSVNDTFNVAIVGPVVHYTMGGVSGDEHGRVLREDGSVISGLYCAGECLGGVHGHNRLGGSSLLDCVVFGRQSGKAASVQLMQEALAGSIGGEQGSLPGSINVEIRPGTNSVTVSWDGTAATTSKSSTSSSSGSSSSSSESASEPESDVDTKKVYTMEEIAQHATKDDCWVAVNGDVYDVTDFLEDHPGGANAILLYAGGDASKEFNMMHKPQILTKYGGQYRIGSVAENTQARL